MHRLLSCTATTVTEAMNHCRCVCRTLGKQQSRDIGPPAQVAATKNSSGVGSFSFVACQAIRSSGQTLLLAEQCSSFPSLLFRHTVVHFNTYLLRKTHACILLQWPCEEKHLPLHAGVIQARHLQKQSHPAEEQFKARLTGAVFQFTCVYV